MKPVAFVHFPNPVTSPAHITALQHIRPGEFYLHHHDPAKFKTAFHRWFTQLKKRYNLRYLKSSSYQEKGGVILDGRDGKAKVRNPTHYFTVWNAASNATTPIEELI